jgi:hypothetical protein
MLLGTSRHLGRRPAAVVVVFDGVDMTHRDK